MKRLVLLLVPVLLLAGLIAAPSASARVLYTFCYGQVHPSCPARVVWSNQSPAWSAPSGSGGSSYRLTFQSDCNMVFYDPGYPNGVSWATGTYNIPRPCHANWQGDGNWVIYDANGVARWASGTNRGIYGYVFTMNDIGQLWIDRVTTHVWCNHPGSCTYR